MDTISENIRAARLANNLTQGQLAEMIGAKSGNVIYNWEAGFSLPDAKKAAKLCDALGVSADYLLGTSVDKAKVSATELERIKKIRALDEHGLRMVDFSINEEFNRCMTERVQKKVRLLQMREFDLPVSAGTGNYLDESNSRKVVVPATPEAEAADYIVRVSGDSMEAEYHDGDRVFVKESAELLCGDIGIFILNNESYIKKLGKGELISLNQKYPPIKIHDFDDFRCCGKVLGIVG